ncbi:hypothetical protein FHX74_003216 [Friedmanniella endophytica]|uniref:Uncharacterized protein n=1 Tax=Microlunatus kandeliicorticis TaxID=1759536 RepID=A0A7W3IUX6_9ACTN|nr:hypothetical protein [Microlunatus kandeliicorticis]MBA8795580.1 hypothetical protein [Microlunatus kandeliicorticis]
MAPRPVRPARRRRFTPLALITGAAGAAVLALSMNSSLAAFTASITNSVNTAGAGTLVMQEQNQAGSVTCLSTDGTGNNVTGNAATCATINKYGGSTTLVPGQTSSTTVTIKNTGTVPANTFTLAPGTCTQSGGVTGSATDLCSKLTVVITQTVGGNTTTVSPASSTLATLQTGGAITLTAPVTPNTTVTFTFAVTLASSAGNTYQGLAASQPLVWTFTS